MLRARAFRQTNNKIVKIQVHPTHPWLVTADDTDHVSVWNWEHRQVIYELKAGGVDERRLVGAKLEKLAEGDSDYKGKPTEAIRGGSVKQVKFYDDDVRYWQLWRNRSAAAESPSAVDHLTSGFTSPAPSTKGRHFLVICCENKAIFLDLVTMRGRDVPKSELDNRSLVCMEFLTRSSAGDGPLVAFGSTDGVIRVLSMITWKLARRYTAGHKGSIYCLMNFMASSGEALLVSGGSDGLLILWNADHGTDSRDLVPKLSLKAHDGGVVAVELSRVSGSAPQLITIGADKTLAIWDTMTFKELRRIKPVPKLACHSVASWCHPRAPNLDILTCVKDSHIWSIEHPTYSALTRPLCELSSLVPPQVLATHKKLRVFCMVAHPLQPHLVATGTNVGIIVSEFDPRAIPSAAFLPALSGSRDNSASMPLSGFGNSNVSSFSSYDDGSSQRSTESAPLNYQLYSWENFEPVGGMLPQPEWTAWDKTVEYCAFAYQQYMVISSLRPQYRYLGNVAISHATGAVWHRRQLFVATQTTIECVFVDAGVTEIDIETRKMKEEMKLKEAQARAVAEHGELALITVEGAQSSKQEKISLRAPLLQVVRLASFQNAPSVPPFLSLPRQSRGDGDDMDERRASEVAVGGGGVSVAVTRFPVEQKRPVGPLVVAGVRDGVLWLIDRYMCAHAISLNHPGIRCRCLAAYGDAISAVKWASRLGREHHDDLAQFMLGMGYATEALHLPGISKRLEFDLAMQSNDLKRALHCLLTMSNSRDIGQDGLGLDLSDILSLTAEKKEDVVEAVEGIVKFAKEFLDLIDAADATGNADVAREALKRLATAGSVKGALQGHELRGLSLRLANHGELTRLSGLINNLISIGLGRESAFSAAVLGDNALMEKAWQDTGMLAEAVLHAHAHGRPSLKNLVQAWNKTLQKEVEQVSSTKTDAASAFLASLEDPKLTSLSDASKKPPIEILPPGMSSIFASISAPKKPLPTMKTPQPEPTMAIEEPAKPLAIEAPPPSSEETPQTESAPETATDPESAAPETADDSESAAPETAADSEPAAHETAAAAESAAPETASAAESAAPETAAVTEPAAPETAAVAESAAAHIEGPVTETVSEPSAPEKEETSSEDKSDPSSAPKTETAVATEDNSQTVPPPPPPETTTTTTTVKPTENAATERPQVTYPPIRSQPIDFDFLND
ncbi:hypothetical protein BRARA_I00563 [Brassica rapa]|uniref:Uncharacterized protein n=1 Tax=Brassica campestris TaxID=3711 RepID=A0A397XSW3_BRACM|nr:hypothetical protein BRARA_I00563 [Brassica rapa]